MRVKLPVIWDRLRTMELSPPLTINIRNQFDKKGWSQDKVASANAAAWRTEPWNMHFIWKCGIVPVRTVSVFPLWSEPVVFIGVAVDGHAAVVGDGPRHGRYAHDNARCWVVTQDGIRGFAGFSSAAKNKDLPVAHWHAAALLGDRGYRLNRPQRLTPYRCLNFHSPVCWRCGRRVSSSPVKGRSSRQTWWDHRTRRSDCWGTRLWCSAWRWGCWPVATMCLSLGRSTEPVTDSQRQLEEMGGWILWTLTTDLWFGWTGHTHTLPSKCCCDSWC